MDKPQSNAIETRPGYGTVGAAAVLGLLSRTGPEAPPESPAKSPDAARPTDPLPWPAFGDEPTQQLPVVASPRPPVVAPPVVAPPVVAPPVIAPPVIAPPVIAPPVIAPPGKTGTDETSPSKDETPPSKVAARAVIVYEPEPRRSWGLWVLTAILVALTVGVVLGQTIAERPRSVSVARTEPALPGYSTPPEVLPSPSVADPAGQPLPVTGQRVVAPLGTARTRELEVSAVSTLITIRSADLGKRLFEIATLDGSAIPKVVNRANGPRLELVRTEASGRLGAEILLNSRVRWTLRLTGGTAEQDIDMRAGGLAGIDLIGGASRAVLRLPTPKGTIPLTVSGGVSELDVLVSAAVPVRVRLGKGADSAVIDGTAHQRVKSGTALTSGRWTGAPNRYDISASAKVNAVKVNRG